MNKIQDDLKLHLDLNSLTCPFQIDPDRILQVFMIVLILVTRLQYGRTKYHSQDKNEKFGYNS